MPLVGHVHPGRIPVYGGRMSEIVAPGFIHFFHLDHWRGCSGGHGGLGELQIADPMSSECVRTALGG